MRSVGRFLRLQRVKLPESYPVFTTADLPNSERFAKQVLTLPIHLTLDDLDVDRVIVIEAVIDLA